MLPYTITLLATLTIMLYAFWFMDLPLGLQADMCTRVECSV